MSWERRDDHSLIERLVALATSGLRDSGARIVYDSE